LAGVRIEESVGLGGGGDASGEEKLSKDLREVRRLGESCGFFSVWLG
jgi:hypothetical protein